MSRLAAAMLLASGVFAFVSLIYFMAGYVHDAQYLVELAIAIVLLARYE